MNELIKKRLKESIGKRILIFLQNNFRYRGKCLNSDDCYVEILEERNNKLMLFEISNIKIVEVEEP